MDIRQVMLKIAWMAVGILSVSLMISTIHAQGSGKDLLILIKDVTANPTVAKFTLNGTNYLEMCASGKCTINYKTASPYISTPSPDNQYMSYSIDFKVIDNMPAKDIGPKKKEFLEKFTTALYACHVDNIVEDNNQELYYCHDSSGSVTRTFDSKSWVYDMTGTYDAKANTLTFTGNYSHPL